MEHFQEPTTVSSQHEFRRKLNRDPDKNFGKLSSDGRVLVSSLRTALEDAKQRIVKLRDENDEKDDIIEEERSNRIALEEKMEKYLVDLYQNPSINKELHQRLPRAKKKGLLFEKHEEEDHDADGESSDTEEPHSLNQPHLHAADSSIVHRSQDHFEHHAGGATTTAKQNTVQDNISTSTATQALLTSVDSLGTSSATHPIGFQPPFLASQQQLAASPYYMPLYQYQQHFQPNPLASSSMTSIASSSYMGLPSVPAKIYQGNQGIISSNQPKSYDHIPENHQNGLRSVPEENATSANNHQLHTVFNNPPENTNIINQGNQQTSVPPINLNAPMVPMPLFGSGFIPTQQERQDNVSHLTRLLQEISVLKKENRELKEELKEHKRDLELLKLNTDDDNGQKNTDAIYALIEEVKQAEKGGEKAVSQLLQSANDDRNAALQELDRVRLKSSKRNLTLSSNSLTSGSFIEEREEENDYIDGTCTSDSENFNSENEETRLTSLRFEKLLEKQKEITRQQIAAMTTQRDEALDRVNKLRKKIVTLKSAEFPNAAHQNLQAKLKITEKERDIAVKKLQLLSHDMNEVTLMYNLQKALLTDDVNINSSNNPPMSKWTNTVEKRDEALKVDVAEKEERPVSKVEATLKALERENNEKDKRIEKLEALVLRQRKKLNALCAGPLLMED